MRKKSRDRNGVDPVLTLRADKYSNAARENGTFLSRMEPMEPRKCHVHDRDDEKREGIRAYVYARPNKRKCDRDYERRGKIASLLRIKNERIGVWDRGVGVDFTRSGITRER